MSTTQSQHAQKEKSKRPISKGEKLFDALVYGAMNFWGTFILTIPLAYSLEFGALRKPIQAAKKFLTKTGVSEDLAYTLTKTTTTFAGGNVMLLPIKAAEDHKREIVDKFNKMMGDTTDPASIEAAPKQDWVSLLQSRLMAWAMVFVSMTTASVLAGKDKEGVSRFAKFEEWFGTKVANVLKKPTHREAVTNLTDRKQPHVELKQIKSEIETLKERIKDTSKVSGEVLDETRKAIKALKDKIPAHETRTFAYGKLASLDIFATTAAVTLLYIGTRIFGKRNPFTGEEKTEKVAQPITLQHPEEAPKDPQAQPKEKPKPSFAERIADEKEQAKTQSVGLQGS